MLSYTKESLEILRNKIDIVELLSNHVQIKKVGAFYKALCPFHEEKTPSFVVHSSQNNYHCYGCGAHGDAIAFLMNFLKMEFVEAVEYLAERFHVPLQKAEKSLQPSVDRFALKDICGKACRFFEFCLLHTKEGHSALSYLYSRGISLHFIQTYRIGFAPAEKNALQNYMQSLGIELKEQVKAGLITQSFYPFFSERLTIAIQDSMGKVIGFSARKMENGLVSSPKYINTPETPIFKKSKVLFGLHLARKEIIKNKSAIIVEGQFDAMRLHFSGFLNVVAGQGTAFGIEHVKELNHLDIKKVYIAFDADKAGKEAAYKVGNLFQKVGVEVYIVTMEEGFDPDTLLREKGPAFFQELLSNSMDYLTYILGIKSSEINMRSPAQKSKLVESIALQIQSWENPLMVHESLRKLASLTQTPLELLNKNGQGNRVYLQKNGRLTAHKIDGDKIMEADLLRWLFLCGQSSTYFLEMARINLSEKQFRIPMCAHLFQIYLDEKIPKDLLSITIALSDEKEQLFLAEILQKKVDIEKSKELFADTIQKILDRNWMHERESIKEKILTGNIDEEKALELAKEFDTLKKMRPVVKYPSSDDTL